MISRYRAGARHSNPIETIATSGPGVSFYRFTLPLALAGKGAHDGTWHAVLEIDRKWAQRLTHVEASASALAARFAHSWSMLLILP